MTDYTKQIQTLTQQAGRTASVAPPSSTAIGDVANLASTALDFFSQKKASAQLEETLLLQKQAQDAEAQRELSIQKGVRDYRQFRLDLNANDGISPTKIAELDNKFISRFKDPDIANEIISRTNTMMRDNTSDMLTRAITSEKTRANLEREQSKANFELQQEAVKASVMTGRYLDLSTATQEDLRLAVLEGKAEEGRIAKLVSELDVEAKQLSTEEAKRNSQDKLFKSIAPSSFAKDLNLSVSKFISDAGGVNNISSQQLVETLLAEKVNLRKTFMDKYVASTREKGFYVSGESIEYGIQQAEATIDSFVSLLSQEETLKAIQNNTKIIYEGGLLRALANPETRDSALLILGTKYAKVDTSFTNFQNELTFIGNMISGLLDKRDPEMGGKVRDALDILSPLDPAKIQDNYSNVDDVLETILTGKDTVLAPIIKAGGWEKLVDIIAEEGSAIVNPATKETHLADFMKQSSKIMSASIGQFNISDYYNSDQNSEFSGTTALNAKFNPETFQLVYSDWAGRSDARVDYLNGRIRKELKAMEELGATEEQINAWKEEVLFNLGISPTDPNFEINR